MLRRMKQQVLVALSGGVDSAVAAWQLREQGFVVRAAYMKNWINEEQVFGHCPWEDDIRDAEAVCRHLGIEFQVINFMREYRERVVHYLVEGYARGLTPNPDVMCNREMKFGVLLDWAQAQGFSYVATGHYCRRADGTSPYRQTDSSVAPAPASLAAEDLLLEGVDDSKDQSYFLALLRPAQLAQALFPIGHLQKRAVRELARQAGLPNAEKKDSQGICFIGEVRINDFLEKFIPDAPGEIVNLRGEVIGEHRGLHRYTLGQRRGIGLPSNSDFNHYVVAGKDVAQNRLVVGFESERPPGIWHASMDLFNLSWLLPSPIEEPREILARVRYRDASVRARFVPLGGGQARLEFAEPQRALAPGQVCALYDGERLLGGGVFL